MQVVRREGLCLLGAAVAVLAILIRGYSDYRSHVIFKLLSVAVLGLIMFFIITGLRARAHAVGQSARGIVATHSLGTKTWPVSSPPDLQSSLASATRDRSKVRFNPRVNCLYVRDLTEMCIERKSLYWWQQEDFDEFLQVRVEIGKAYRAAAKKLGLDIMQVSSVGSHGDEGYRAMIQSNPKLAGESRRGLGLGRKRQRARNRDAYIAAVINEQHRQQRACEAASRPYVLDDQALAEAARRVSDKDLCYAHYLAQIYYEQDRAVEANEADVGIVVSGTSPPIENRRLPLGDVAQTPTRYAIVRSADAALHDSPIAGTSFCLNDEGVQEGLDRKISPSFSSKGFGLSREKLRMVGLSATGHSISRYQRLRSLNGHGCANEEEHGESDVTAGETDDDGLGGNAEFIAQYRSWRMGAPVRAGLPGHSDVKTYGTRKEYRAWRAWQRPSKERAA
mmetsp:Transcript_7118/g.17693  ORF Transcript_7118/g.17693 Transcript_7118/m.17693 type:complete len:450 (-) Transcript_7118:225-1574(-)